MYCYSIHDKEWTFASIVTDISNSEEFHEKMHRFMCGDSILEDRRYLTVEDFGEHLREEGYVCEVFIHKEDYHWWLQDD